MSKNFTAIASVSADDQPSSMSAEQALEYMKSFIATNKAGYVLSADDLGGVINALKAIGSDEVSISEGGALQGKGTVEYTAEGAGLTVAVSSDLECQGVWDRGRMLWSTRMNLQKNAGDEEALELVFKYHFISFGTGSDGNGKVFYNYSYTKTFKDDNITEAFNAGEKVASSQCDVSTNQQWGYCLIATCEIITAAGNLSV